MPPHDPERPTISVWHEIGAYLEYVDRKYDLSKDTRLNTLLETARFDGQRNHWLVTDDKGVTVRTRFLIIICPGFAFRPHYPTSDPNCGC